MRTISRRPDSRAPAGSRSPAAKGPVPVGPQGPRRVGARFSVFFRHVARDSRPVRPPGTSPWGLVNEYGSGARRVTALAGVDVELTRGGFTAIMGPSGSGKSTLLSVRPGWTPPPGAAWPSGTPSSGISTTRR
ncbi:ATP-binding cassette domain-containing protein [Embleya scabrispora]|uniref:ATP-binding cassette domain-containing protein n=1 Tax=Embleya scabrispora TaxID=159449 RepID=UPI0039C857E4